jgi:hypothetical protein
VGVSFIDHHDCVFPGQRHHVTPARVFVEFRTSGEGPRNQETLRHVTVYELVPYGVRVVQVGLLKESLDVVCRRPHLTLVAMRSSHNTPHIRVDCLLVIAVIMVGRGHGPLGALPGAVDDDDGQHLLTAAWGRLPASLGRKKFNRLIADGILGGNIALLLGGVPENIDVCALAWVPCAMFRSRTHGPLASLSVSMAFGAPALLPQRGLRREISWQ